MPQVYFSAYRPTELQEILMQVMSEMGVQPGSLEEQVWPHFVSGVVCDQFVQLSRHACDLKALAITLWPPYIRPLQESPELAGAPLESIVRQLMGRAKRHLLPPCLAVFEPGMSHPLHITAAMAGTGVGQGLGPRQGEAGRGVAGQLGLSSRAQHEADWGGLPVTAKLLLVAAFIASHNKPTLDKAVFDVRAKSGRSRCKHADLQSDRQAEAAKEAKLKGPATFSLQRLLNIYNFLYAAADHHATSQPQGSRLGAAPDISLLLNSFVLTSKDMQGMEAESRLQQESGGEHHGAVVVTALPARGSGSGRGSAAFVKVEREAEERTGPGGHSGHLLPQGLLRPAQPAASLAGGGGLGEGNASAVPGRGKSQSEPGDDAANFLSALQAAPTGRSRKPPKPLAKPAASQQSTDPFYTGGAATAAALAKYGLGSVGGAGAKGPGGML
ncbi:hypothetical protein QJQ45_022849, partial [Haematococcus lacustris]